MEAKLVINGVDFVPYCAANGIQQSDIVRRSVSVTTLDGTLHHQKIIKRQLSVSLVELRNDTLKMIITSLSSPATVEYTDKSGVDRSGTFYISGPDATEKTISGGNTYWTGITLTLTEK
ncbi:MAG: hypothetical protein J6K98_04605 [Clostridia bacterium]|nr:hypothetical protein [Clostridia bacterium]